MKRLNVPSALVGLLIALGPLTVLRASPLESAGAGDDGTALVARGRQQYLAGDSAAALQTFTRAAELAPQQAEVKNFLERLSRERVATSFDRSRTSTQMLEAINLAWQRAAVKPAPETVVASPVVAPRLREKLHAIILPSVNFTGLELSQVINTLSVLSEELDNTGTTPKGVNIVLIDPARGNPTVNLTLRNLPLKRALDFITDSVGYQYELQADAIIVRPGGEQSPLDTQFFPIARSTVLRMTGKGLVAPPKPGPSAPTPGPHPSAEDEGQTIRNFLQLAGVSFDGVSGGSLAFDGSQLIVTQTPRNLERIRNILQRYSEVRQVEIEAKFMEIQQGQLDELGVQWNVSKKPTQHSGATATQYLSSNRSLADAFTNSSGGTRGSIVRGSAGGVAASPDAAGAPEIPILVNPPPIPGTNNLGYAANPLGVVTGVVGEFNVTAIVRALAQKSGTELLSAPKLTVLSGNPATITIAQELRYPQSFGQVQSQVGTGSASGGGSAGVAITAGTPQEFTTRNVGVELKVTPTVEEDDRSISLDLNPKVTEFEGFVEYGGQSIAISGGTTVTVPSGFYQPIFGVREMSTKVTIWDGATLIMGGLTREDVKQVSDKIPVLGNLPGLGRFFRSKGESTQKRNLLIFVTANLVNPGGALKKQAGSGPPPDSLYQNPTIVTPGGISVR